MASIELIKGSDGSGNAQIATVQNTRSIGASTIIVDTVVGINPTGFAGSMGTPHTFVDPITSEEITVISEATAVDFVGHVDGANLEIDTIAPGYTDAGSAVGDIVIIRPTTQYADNLAEVLETSHDDDGTLNAAALAQIYPVGSIYTNAAVSTNPATLLGFGTWTAFGSGRVLVGVDAAQTEFDTLGETGGAKTHTLTTAEMPSHSHNISAAYTTAGGGTTSGTAVPPHNGVASGGNFAVTSGSAGSGGAHNNLQPYITVYMWQRTA